MDGQNATTALQSATEATSNDAEAPATDQVEDVLVEEVSIDGMCGVY